MNLWNKQNNSRDTEERKTITVRQLLIRTVFYVVIFAAIIWWATK